MSFAGTPLGQGRRLDHHNFLNKTNLAINQSNPSSAGPGDTVDGETALARYARLKRARSLQQPQSSLNPEMWVVKDTSVNIAAAFNQAASTSHETHPSNPNNAWASRSQTNLNVPRSTSVDYEKETHSTTSRRLAPPPSRLPQRNGAKPSANQDTSSTPVPDSEPEDNQESHENDRSARGKSPFEQVVDISKRALTSATTFYMRPRSMEPADVSTANTTMNDRNSSYDYASEEQEFQEIMRQKQTVAQHEQQEQAASQRSAVTHKRNRMTMDNRAYRPSHSDVEEGSESDTSDDDQKRRRKIKKRDSGGGPLTTLPVAGYEKRRKKKRGSKTSAAEDEEDNSASGSEQHSSARSASATRGSVTRTSVPLSRSSIPRASPPSYSEDPANTDVVLDSIPEVDEPPVVGGSSVVSDQPSRSFSIGGTLGRAVHRLVRFLLWLFAWTIRILALIYFAFGYILGSIFDTVYMRPAAFFSSVKVGPLITLCKYLFIAIAIYAPWQLDLQGPVLQMLPTRYSQRPFYARDTPITNLDELSSRLQNIEAALSGISLDQQRSRTQIDLEARAHGDVVNRIFALEARIREEARRISDTEVHLKTSSSQGFSDIRREIQVLQSQLGAVTSSPTETTTPVPLPPTHDTEAWTKLKILEDRLGGVESGVKHALEQAKNAAESSKNVPSGDAWWSKLASTVGTSAGLTIKSTDGSDVTSLMSQLVDSIVRYGTQDIISRADFALHSAGARPIPHLTSRTLEWRPSTLQGQVLGLITGHGYEVGRSPVTALHQDLHTGNCWPMTGSYGQLGVMLALPAVISDITIDHVAKEVAFDLATAPRDMEVWGQVEGEDNMAKVAAWRAEQAKRRQEAEEAGEPISEADIEDVYPSTLPKDVPFIRLASFTYDIHAPSNVQTFPIRQEVKDLELDFGIVALVIKSNWGKDGYTCIYRFRVHGQQLASPSTASLPEN